MALQFLKTIFKKLACLSLSACMIAGLLSGCGGPGGSGGGANNNLVKEQAEQYKDVTDVKEITDGVKLTIAIPSSARVLDFETNQQTVMIEEKLGVDLEFIVLPSADYASKLNIMITGGEELPDIIFDPSGYANWIEEGVLFDLTEFYANGTFAANINAGMERSGIDLVKYLTRPEGGIYCVPSFREETYTSVQQKLWVYKPWLDKLGKTAPTTLDEYYELCKLVVAGDMNGNNKKDEIGITGSGLTQWFDCLMSSFVYAHDSNWRLIENGQISFAYTTDEWKEGLKYIKRFFDEGLIPQEAITQSGDQFDSHRYADEQSVFGFADWVPGTNKGLAWKNEWVAMMPLIGPEGEQNAMRRTSGLFPSAGAAITIDCENPAAAFLVCDFLCDIDFGISARYGEQGVNWDYWENAQESLINGSKADYQVDDTYPVQFIAYDDNTFWGSNEPQDNCWLQQGCYILPPNSLAVKTTNLSEDETLILEFNQYYNEIVAELQKYGPEEIVDSAPLTTDESAAIADAKALLKDYVKESIGSFLTGAWDIDAKWDEYLAELEKMGYKQVLEAYQTGYDRTH